MPCVPTFECATKGVEALFMNNILLQSVESFSPSCDRGRESNPILQLQLKSESGSSCRVNFSAAAALIRDTSPTKDDFTTITHSGDIFHSQPHICIKPFQLQPLFAEFPVPVSSSGSDYDGGGERGRAALFLHPRMFARRRTAPLSRACVRERSVGLCIHVLIRFVCVGSSEKRGKLLLCWPLFIIIITIIIVLCFIFTTRSFR